MLLESSHYAILLRTLAGVRAPALAEDMVHLRLDILRCPACAGQPRPDPGVLDLVADKWLVCRECGRKYPIRSQVPVLMIAEGDKHRRTPIEKLGDP